MPRSFYVSSSSLGTIIIKGKTAQLSFEHNFSTGKLLLLLWSLEAAAPAEMRCWVLWNQQYLLANAKIIGLSWSMRTENETT